MQRLFTVIVLALLVYSAVIYRDNKDDSSERGIVENLRDLGSDLKSLGDDILMPNKNMEEFEQAFEGNIIERSLSKVAVNVLQTEEGQRFLGRMITPEMQTLQQGKADYSINIRDAKLVEELLSIRVLRPGSGPVVCCGHMVEIYYTLSRNGENILDNKEIRALGAKSDIPILDSIVAGMKVGEVREATIPKEFSFTMADGFVKEAYTIRVALENVLSKHLVKPQEIRVFDDTISYNLPYFCGDTAQFDAKITSISDGIVVFDSSMAGEQISMRLGDGNYPIIFAYALFNKPPIGARTVIVQGQYFDSVIGKGGNNFLQELLNPQEFYLLELNHFTRTASTVILLPGSTK